MTRYYYLGSQRVAMRQGGVLTYLHGDHLGSASLATNATGAKVSEQRYLPYGGTRSGSMPTDRQYTGQRREASLGFYDYVARQFDPALGRFLQADTIVPGAASGSGGGAATLGYDSKTRLTPLTVNLGEFAMQISAENREVLQFGAFFQWDSKTRQEHNVPMGPPNPQALNRYAYCLNNPLRYVDPTGHDIIGNQDVGAEVLLDDYGNEVTIDGRTVYRVWINGIEMYVFFDDPNFELFRIYAVEYANACNEQTRAVRDVIIKGGIATGGLLVTGFGISTAPSGFGIIVAVIGVGVTGFEVADMGSSMLDWSESTRNAALQSRNAWDVFRRMMRTQVLID